MDVWMYVSDGRAQLLAMLERLDAERAAIVKILAAMDDVGNGAKTSVKKEDVAPPGRKGGSLRVLVVDVLGGAPTMSFGEILKGVAGRRPVSSNSLSSILTKMGHEGTICRVGKSEWSLPGLVDGQHR